MSTQHSRTFYKRSGRRNRHHILAKSRGGRATEDNLICLDENRHAAYHLLFHNLTFKEAAFVLLRAHAFRAVRAARDA